MVKTKFTIFALLYFVLEGKFQVQVLRGAYIRGGGGGHFNGGFFALRFWGLIFGGAYFRNFTVSVYLPGQYKISCRLCFFSLPVKKRQKLMPWNDLRTQSKTILKVTIGFALPSTNRGNKY